MWYCTIDDQERGPFSELELRALLDVRGIQPQTRVRRTGDPEWAPLELTSLAEALGLRPAIKVRRHRCAYSGMKTPRADMCLVDGFWVAKDYKQEAENYVRHGGWLPTEVSGLRARGEINFGRLTMQTARLLCRAGLPACVAQLAVNIPFCYAVLLPQAQPARNGGPSPVTEAADIAVSAGWLTVQALALTGVLVLLSRCSRDVRPSLAEWLRGTMTCWGPVASVLVFGLLACVTAHLGMRYFFGPPGGSRLFMLAGIFVIVGILVSILPSLFAPLVVVDRGLPPWLAIRQSWSLSSRQTGHSLACLLLLSFALSICFGVVFSLTASLWPPGIETPAPVKSALLGLVLIPVLASLFCYYKELEALYLSRMEKAT